MDNRDESQRLSPLWQSIWLLVGVPTAALYVLGLVWQLQPTSYRYRDLTQDWLSARCYKAGLPIYTRHEVSVPRFLSETEELKIKVNAHPPVSVLLLLPLGWLEHEQALLTWNLVSLAFVPLAVWLMLGRWGLNTDPWCWLAVLVLVICSSPLANQVKYAQFNPLLLLLLVLAWVCDRRGFVAAAGAFVGCAAGLKLFPAFMLLYFFGTRRWSGLIAGIGVILVLHMVAACVFGIEELRHYFQVVVPEVDVWRSAWLNCSFAGYWSRLFDVTDGQTRELLHAPILAKLLTYVFGGGVTFLAGWRCWRSETLSQRDLAWAGVVIAMLLVSPVTWDHYLLLLTLPLAIGWYYAQNLLLSRWVLTLSVFIAGLVSPYVMWKWLLKPSPSSESGFAVVEPWQSLAVLGLATYVLVACLLWIVGRQYTRQISTEAIASNSA